MMNSKELNVNVPLATVDSDSEEFEVTALTEIKVNSPKWLSNGIKYYKMTDNF